MPNIGVAEPMRRKRPAEEAIAGPSRRRSNIARPPPPFDVDVIEVVTLSGK